MYARTSVYIQPLTFGCSMEQPYNEASLQCAAPYNPLIPLPAISRKRRMRDFFTTGVRKPPEKHPPSQTARQATECARLALRASIGNQNSASFSLSAQFCVPSQAAIASPRLSKNKAVRLEIRHTASIIV